MSSDSEEKELYVPANPLVSASLTDLYQLSMAYAYWANGRQDEPAVFDLFFRKNPFEGEFTIFAGLDACLRFVSNFQYTEREIEVLRKMCPQWKPGFWEYLAAVNCSAVKIYAIPEGTVVFPREPLVRVEGPLAVCQLLETTLLNCVNFPSLVCTNAARHRIAVGPDKTLLEFGLRRAQGPDGAMTASKYAYVGGFDGTSNVKASIKYGIACRGTQAHSFVVSYKYMDELRSRSIIDAQGNTVEAFATRVQEARDRIAPGCDANNGELAAFIAYAQAHPEGFLALIDTYDTLKSGVINFLAVALVLHEIGYKPIGVRLDSGDLAYLSIECRRMFREASAKLSVPFEDLRIVASNDLSEAVLYSLKEQKHEIDSFGIGTNLVTCKGQPALGCVYKLVEVNGNARIKLSQEVTKVVIPGRKALYRLYNKSDEPVLDLLVRVDHEEPIEHHRILCRHPFDAKKRAHVTPSRVEPLHSLVWDGCLVSSPVSLDDIKLRVEQQLRSLRSDHKRWVNPTPYKLSLTSDLYDFMHELWMNETPIAEIS